MASRKPKPKPKPKSLPEFGEDDRNLLVLAVRAGFDGTAIETLDMGVIDAWLERGRDDLAAGKQSEAATFVQTYDNAVRDAVRTYVLAANVWRDRVRSDPTAARTYLREQAAEAELARARELTAEAGRG